MRRICVAIFAMLPGLALAGNCWEEAGIRYRIDPWLLYSIAKKESGLDPSQIHVNRDGSYDIGLMQINSTHLPKLSRFGITEKMLTDPCTNINVGAWVLSWNIHQHGNTTFALGAYNAGATRSERQESRRRRYADAVLTIYRQELANIGVRQP